MRYFIEENTLTEIADAVREKGGTTGPIMVSELATAITNLPSGGGGSDIPDYAFNLTGDIQYRFYSDSWNWFIQQYGKQITATDITSINQTFCYSDALEEIPFDIYMKPITSGSHNVKGFMYCTALKEVPYLYNARPADYASLFTNCKSLVEVPQDYFDTWDFGAIDTQTSAYSGNTNSLFQSCTKLERFPMTQFEHGNPVANYSTSIYKDAFSGCYSITEVLGMPFPHTNVSWTSNVFSGTFSSCFRLSRFTFKLQEDGSPYVVNWKNQKIDLGNNLGYCSSSFERNQLLDNTRFTPETEVNTAEQYEALKNNPDWWSSSLLFCRYGHDSAVETINSLPDTSAYLATAGGTNTITFKLRSGTGNDDGGVVALTQEEIAVAAARGWTVAYTSY